MYEQSLNNVNNNINLYGVLLFGFLTVAGVALYFWAKSVVETALNKGIEKLNFENQETLNKLKEMEKSNEDTTNELREAMERIKETEKILSILLGAEEWEWVEVDYLFNDKKLSYSNWREDRKGKTIDYATS